MVFMERSVSKESVGLSQKCLFAFDSFHTNQVLNKVEGGDNGLSPFDNVHFVLKTFSLPRA